MAKESQTVRRTVQFKFTLPTADPDQLASLVKSATPFYQAFGGHRVRLLQNVDDPARFIHEIEYDTHEIIELNRQRVASDPARRLRKAPTAATQAPLARMTCVRFMACPPLAEQLQPACHPEDQGFSGRGRNTVGLPLTIPAHSLFIMGGRTAAGAVGNGSRRVRQ